MGRDFTLADLEREGFKAIFLATGASKSRRLGVPGDEQRGVIPATRFLKEVNLGESPHLSGDVVVVGGGSTAMDAARSARRSGAASVTIVYRRGRRDMPAQDEEIEAAEREGITILEGLAPTEVVGRDAAVVALRCDVLRADEAPGADGRATWSWTGDTRELPGEHDPRRDRRGARSVHPPGGRGHRGQRLGRDRRRSEDPGHRPRGHLRRRRRRLRATHDHRGGRGRPPRRRVDPRVPRGRPRRRGRDPRRGPLRDGAGGIAHRSTSSRGRGSMRRCRSSTSGRSRPPSPASPERRPMPRPAAASAATRSTAVRPCRCVAGRGPADGPRAPDPDARPRSRRQAPPTSPAGRCAVTPDQVSGFFDAGESFVEGTIAAALVVLWVLVRGAPPRPPVHGPQHRQVHPPAGRGPVVDHLRRAARHHPAPGLPRHRSSSSTRTSSPGRTCRSPAASRPSAPSPRSSSSS